MEQFTPEGVFDPVVFADKVDTLKQLINNALVLLVEGKTLMAWKGEGDEGTLELLVHPMKIIVEAQYTLKQIDPFIYGALITTAKPYII